MKALIPTHLATAFVAALTLLVAPLANAVTTIVSMGFNSTGDIDEVGGWDGTSVGAGGSIDPNVVLQSLLKVNGTFASGLNSADVFHVDNYHTTTSSTNYVSFAIAAAPGYVLDLNGGGAAFSTRLHQHPAGATTDMFNLVTLTINGVTVGSQSYTGGASAQTLTWGLSGNPSLDNVTTADIRMYFSGTADPGSDNHGPEWRQTDGANISLSGNVFAIPEPSRALLALSGLGLVSLRRRRRLV